MVNDMGVRKTTKYIVVHTTATKTKHALTEKSLRAMHKARGFSDIGYGGWVDRKGKIRRGRGWNKIGAHVRGFNSVSVGIAWEGGYSGNDITKAQETALWGQIAKLCKMYPGAKVCGHRDLSPDGDKDGVVEPHEWTKSCPWFYAELEAKKRGLPHTNFSGKAGVVSEPRPKGPDMRDMWLQKLLRQEGANIVPDGYVGLKTAEAIKVFQEDHGIAITRIFDENTVALLRSRAERRNAENTVQIVKEVVPTAVQNVVNDAAGEGRTSTTNLAAGAVAISGGATAVTKVTEAVSEVSNSTTGMIETIGNAGPWALLGIMTIGGAWYIWRERSRKAREAQAALHA